MRIIGRRVEQLQRALTRWRRRCITILVDPNEEDQSSACAIAQQLKPGPHDVVIYRGQYGRCDRDLPRLLAVPRSPATLTWMLASTEV
jgi:hypothetical protein